MTRLKQKRKWLYFLILLSLLFISIITFHHPKIDLYDGFENSRLSGNWSSSRMESSSFETQSIIVHKGQSAAKITLHTGDKVEDKTNQDKSSERDELTEAMSLYSIEGAKYEYKFSMFLPDSFPITSTRLVIAQWKQFCPFCSCSEYSPILALRYISGKLFLTLQTSSIRDTLYISSEEIRNRWLDFKFQIKFSKQNDGEVKAFLGDNRIADYKGITSYSNNCRVLSDKNKYYFKMGLYRDRMKEPMTVYIDEYHKIQLGDN